MRASEPTNGFSSEQVAASMRRFLDMSIDLLAIADLESRVLELSESWERVLGWTRAEMLGQPLMAFVHDDDLPRAAAELAGLVAGDEAVSVDLRFVAKDGSRRWLQGNARSDLQAGLLFITAADITGRMETEQELLDARRQLEHRNEELERSNEDLERFAQAAAHDLTAPLARIEMALAATPRPAGDSGLLVDVARRGATRMRQLIEALLTFSAVGQGTSLPEEVDLDELVTLALADLAAVVEATGAEVHREPLPTAWGHRSLLGQVFQNLIGNSVKFAREGVSPRVEITGSQDETGTTVRVADNGIGIAVAQRAAVFGVFTRLNADEQYPGSGIGLATCAKVVAHHGGTICVEDGLDGGVAMVVWLPAQPAASGGGSA